jgi:hypothetical protein
LTHFEVRRGSALRLRLSIADDAVIEVSDELGALLRKIAPGAARPATPNTMGAAPNTMGAIAIGTTAEVEEFVVSPLHEDDDHHYHATLRDRLSELFNSLCDASLADALEIARQERTRRAEGRN